MIVVIPEHRLSFLAGRRGLLDGRKSAQSEVSSVVMDLSSPFAIDAVYSEDAARIVPTPFLVAAVLLGRGIPQIFDTVVGRIAIDVVDHFRGP